MSEKKTKRKTLTQKQEAFALAYFEKGNASEAYREVYKPKKASDKVINNEASKLLKHREIAVRLAELRAKVEAKEILTVEEVMRSLARDIRFDPAKLLDERGNLKSVAVMDEDTRLALRGMEHYAEFAGRGGDREQVGTTSKVRFPEKAAAREQAMKHLGMFERDNKQKSDPVGELFKWLNEQNAKTGSHGLPVKA